jgi:hypothetical protein
MREIRKLHVDEKRKQKLEEFLINHRHIFKKMAKRLK